MNNKPTDTTNYYGHFSRISHLATAQMHSLHNYLEAETDGFTAWENLNGLDLDEVLYDHFKTIDGLLDKVVVGKGYSGQKVEGKNYRQTKDLPMNEIVKLIKEELAIRFPGCRFSVKQDNGSTHYSLRGNILDVDFDPVAQPLRDALKQVTTYHEYRQELNKRGGSHWNEKEVFSSEYLAFYKKAESIFQQYNYNDSDPMTDYFSVRYYGHITGLDLEKYLAQEADPGLKARQEEAEKERRRLEAIATEKKKADNLVRFGAHKKGDIAIYIANFDQRQGCYFKGDRLPCEILKVPNGRSRYGGTFTIRLYYPLANVAKNKLQYVKPVTKPGFEGEYVYFNTLESIAASSLESMRKPEPEKPKPAPKQAITPAKPPVTPAAKYPQVPGAKSPVDEPVKVVRNVPRNGIEVSFSAIPSEQSRAWLKSEGYRWSKFSQVWYASYTAAALLKVEKYFGVELSEGDWSRSLPATAAPTSARSQPTESKPTGAPKSAGDAGLAVKFHKTAESFQAEADKKNRELASANRNTQKRNKEANSKQIDADQCAEKASIYKAIGKAIEAGTLPPILHGITPVKSDNCLYLFIAGHDNSGGYYAMYRANHPYYQSEFKKSGQRKLNSYDLSNKIELKTYDQVDEAYQAIQALLGGAQVVDPNKAALNKLVDNWRFANEKGFFPTPGVIGDRLVGKAELKPGMSVLEPSAGLGDLCERIMLIQPLVHLDVVERFVSLREILALKGFNVVGDDILTYSGKQYDRIIMNPPFESLQDVEHVRYCYDNLLKPGGRLVAIMGTGAFFNSNKKAEAFREWLDENGSSSELPPDAFKTAFRPTGVQTRMVIIDKPGQAINKVSIDIRARALVLVLRLRDRE